MSTVALVTDDEASLRKLGVSTDIHTRFEAIFNVTLKIVQRTTLFLFLAI